MEETSFLLGLVSAILHGSAYVLYNIQTQLGKSRPNPASWGIWMVLSTLNAFTYREVAVSVLATLQFYTGSIACIGTFIYVLAIGKLARPSSRDMLYLVLGGLATVVWLVFKSAVLGNMIILAAFVISFQPTLEGVWSDPHKEEPLAWILWSGAFIASMVNAILLGNLFSIITPFVLLLLHGTVAFLSRKGRKIRFAQVQ